MEDGKAGGQKWWEKDEGTTEYEADIDIPLILQQDRNAIMVEDTEDMYCMPTTPEHSSPPDQSLYYTLKTFFRGGKKYLGKKNFGRIKNWIIRQDTYHIISYRLQH